MRATGAAAANSGAAQLRDGLQTLSSGTAELRDGLRAPQLAGLAAAARGARSRGVEVQLLDDGTTRVPARMAIDDFAELFEVSITEDAVDTVGGLLTKLLGRVPLVGATVQIEGLTLRAERMAGRRHQIATVSVDRQPPTPESAESADSAESGETSSDVSDILRQRESTRGVAHE